MIAKNDLETTSSAMGAMESLLKQGLNNPSADPFREFVGSSGTLAIEYARTEREKYVGEVGKRDGFYVYHFWPRTNAIAKNFGDKLGDAMLAVFKHPERVAAKHDVVLRCFEGEETSKAGTILCRFWGHPEDFENNICPNCGSTNVNKVLDSWAVRVSGYGGNPLADDLAANVFVVLDSLL